MESVIRVKNLTVRFPGKVAVQGVDLELFTGELVALVGESGSGKSVLCRALLSVAPKSASVSHDCLERPELRKMSLIMQDAMTSLDPAMPIGKQITEGNRAYSPDPAVLLERVGIDNPRLRARQYPGELSGGMRQRAAAAVALASEPSIIFADEPTTSLDYEMREKMMELLSDIRMSGTAVLFVTHDLSLVRDYADRVLIMKDGKIIERGETAAIFENPQDEYTKELLRGALIGSPENHTHGKIHYHAAVLHSHDHAGSHRHDLHTHSGDTHTHEAPRAPLIEAKSLCKVYPISRRRQNRVLDNMNIVVYPGEITGLCGPSGVGKSTLARLLAGLEKPSGGEINARRGLDIQMIFQDSASALNPRMSAMQLIAEPLYLRDRKPPPREVILELMHEAQLSPELISRRPGEMSGGQRQRVAIARAISTHPDLIIADEPVSSLDVTTCSRIIHLLKHLRDEHNLTMLLISHDLHMLAHVSDRIVQM